MNSDDEMEADEVASPSSPPPAPVVINVTRVVHPPGDPFAGKEVNSASTVSAVSHVLRASQLAMPTSGNPGEKFAVSPALICTYDPLQGPVPREVIRDLIPENDLLYDAEIQRHAAADRQALPSGSFLAKAPWVRHRITTTTTQEVSMNAEQAVAATTTTTTTSSSSSEERGRYRPAPEAARRLASASPLAVSTSDRSQARAKSPLQTPIVSSALAAQRKRITLVTKSTSRSRSQTRELTNAVAASIPRSPAAVTAEVAIRCFGCTAARYSCNGTSMGQHWAELESKIVQIIATHPERAYLECDGFYTELRTEAAKYDVVLPPMDAQSWKQHFEYHCVCAPAALAKVMRDTMATFDVVKNGAVWTTNGRLFVEPVQFKAFMELGKQIQALATRAQVNAKQMAAEVAPTYHTLEHAIQTVLTVKNKLPSI